MLLGFSRHGCSACSDCSISERLRHERRRGQSGPKLGTRREGMRGMERVPHRYLVQECDRPAVQVHRAWVGRRVVVNSRRVIIVASVMVGGGVSSGVVGTGQRLPVDGVETCGRRARRWVGGEMWSDRELGPTDARMHGPRTHSISFAFRSTRLSERSFPDPRPAHVARRTFQSSMDQGCTHQRTHGIE